MALLGANGAGKSTTLKAISNLLLAERGEVTKGQIHCRGERVDGLTPNDLVRRGVIQVMEGRHCFGHLTVEENLLTGAFIHGGKRRQIADDLEKVYHYFPRLQGPAHQPGRLHLGRRAADDGDRPRPDEPAHAPSCSTSRRWAWRRSSSRRSSRSCKNLNEQAKVSILLAEQNTNVALRYAHYGYILENGRVVLDGDAAQLARERGREGVLSRHRRRGPPLVPRRQALQKAQALALGCNRARPAAPRRRAGGSAIQVGDGLMVRRARPPDCRQRA